MRRITRWHAGAVATLALAGAGFVVASSALFLAAIVPLSFLLYGAISTVPDPDTALVARRTAMPENPLPGESVEVELTVENAGDRTIADARIADGVPPELAVIEGRSNRAVTLRGGESATVSYTLQPRRGAYSFSPVDVRVRSLSASVVSTTSIDADGTGSIDCRVPADGVPVHRRTIPFVGAVATDSGGPGFEFHSTREYQHGDSVRRVDWRRYARTDELGTVLYREQEATKIVTLIDGRSTATSVAAQGRPDGVTLSVYAAVVAMGALTDAGHSVGVGGLGVSATIPGAYAGPPVYVEPAVGAAVSGRIARVCDAIAAGPGSIAGNASNAGDSADAGADVARRRKSRMELDELRSLLPPDAQLLVCTPVLDESIVEAVATLRRRGYPVTVLSPDLTGEDHVGARIESVHRTARLERLRRLDVAVLDWAIDEPLSVTLERGFGTVVR